MYSGCRRERRDTQPHSTPHTITERWRLTICTDLSPLASRHVLQTLAAVQVVQGLLRQQQQRRPEGQQISSSSSPLRQQHIHIADDDVGVGVWWKIFHRFLLVSTEYNTLWNDLAILR